MFPGDQILEPKLTLTTFCVRLLLLAGGKNGGRREGRRHKRGRRREGVEKGKEVGEGSARRGEEDRRLL